jgi:hypothetical protein
MKRFKKSIALVSALVTGTIVASGITTTIVNNEISHHSIAPLNIGGSINKTSYGVGDD